MMTAGVEHEVWMSQGGARRYYWCNVCGVIAGGRAGDGTSFAPNFCRGPPAPRPEGARKRGDTRAGQLRGLREGTHTHRGTKEVIPVGVPVRNPALPALVATPGVHQTVTGWAHGWAGTRPQAGGPGGAAQS